MRTFPLCKPRLLINWLLKRKNLCHPLTLQSSPSHSHVSQPHDPSPLKHKQSTQIKIEYKIHSKSTGHNSLRPSNQSHCYDNRSVPESNTGRMKEVSHKIGRSAASQYKWHEKGSCFSFIWQPAQHQHPYCVSNVSNWDDVGSLVFLVGLIIQVLGKPEENPVINEFDESICCTTVEHPWNLPRIYKPNSFPFQLIN